ncbi:MAG: ParB N-terminal domain-containing protein [Candidatus Symbiothrix sp.]|jgi:hypothetical protein|nr:ParB N-terminal domain-containing protein [Candidatus Symbiothrix sp.]
MIQKIKLTELEANQGQIEGLPVNPRQIHQSKFEKLKKSLQEDPEMLELREILVFQYGKKYIVIGGNMRYRAAIELGIKELPCKIIPPETSVQKLKAYTIKDNASFGDWSYDDLANEWDSKELEDWGVDVWKDDDKWSDDDFFNEEDTIPLQNDKNEKISLIVKSTDENMIISLFSELNGRGFECEIKK